MPAITVDDLTVLPRIAVPDPSSTRQRPVESVTTAPRGLEGEGFPVFRAFAGVDLAALDPFIHLDQMGEVDYGPGEPKGTPWHPHRGFETVTYMIDGLLQHNDSQGGGGLISDGGTQWMTAGKGILHIETPPQHVVDAGGRFHGLQLWVNLPKRQKWVDPRYQDLNPEQVLLLSSDDGGALIRVIAGNVAGHEGPGSTYTPINMLHATVSPGAQLDLPWPADFNSLVYVLAGSGTIGAGKRPLRMGQLAVLGHGDAVTLTADTKQDSHTASMEVLLLGGKPIREPVAWAGPFVMNTKAEIAQAFDDFEAGRLGQVPTNTNAPTDELVEETDSGLD
jgi:redox-sensitive bicupin YhaK (pirin superfamily)